MKKFIDNLMAQMTLDEKIGQLNMVGPGDISQVEDGAGIVTGVAMNDDVGGKIRSGQVGAILNVPTSYDKGAAASIRAIQERAVNESRLGIPIMFWLDIIHGHKTIFPIGAVNSWDMDLIQKSARIEALEGSADGYHGTFSPMVDIVRDPRWGRVAESLCEDAYLGSRVAEAKVKGYQGDDLTQPGTLMACIKHFAAYGAPEAGIDYGTVDMSPMKLHESYLPPYKAGVKAGAGSLMAAFNDVNGVPCHANRMLMTDVLRKSWKFNGFTMGDYTGVNEMVKHGIGDEAEVAARAVTAGLDMEMVGELYVKTLKTSLEEGRITERDIDLACRRILEAKYKLGLFTDPYRGIDPENAPKQMRLPEYRAVARELAAKSCVLLKNDKAALPLKTEGKIALIGPLAADVLNVQGTWAVAGASRDSVSLLTGVQALAGDAEILHAQGANITDDPEEAKRVNVFGVTAPISDRTPDEMIAEALSVAEQADVIVAVLGEAKEHSGECSSRTDIGLPASQKRLLNELHKTGKQVVLVLMSGRPLTIKNECDQVDAVLQTWFGGSEAGNGIADVLFGKHNPSGKLTMTFPYNVGQIPIYYNQRTGGRPPDAPEYEKFKRVYMDAPYKPLFPFGYGLSYTTFEYGEVTADKVSLKNNDVLKASVRVTNTGDRAGDEVVQLYIQDPVATITRPVKDLKGFQKVSLQPGESKDVTFEITPEELKFFHPDLSHDWEGGEFIIHIGTSSAQTKTLSVQWDKDKSLLNNVKTRPQVRQLI